MYQVYNDEYLMHHGIKGQRWGIRRYQNSDGSLTNAGRARYNVDLKRSKQDVKDAAKKYRRTFKKADKIAYKVAEAKYRNDKIKAKLNKETKKSKHRLNLEKKYLQKGFNQEEAEIAAYKRARTEKIIAACAATALVAVSAYLASKEIDRRMDKIVSDNTPWKRIASSDNKELNDVFYQAHGRDVQKYEGLYGAQKGYGFFGGVYEKSIKTSGLKIASQERGRKALQEVISSDSSLKTELMQRLEKKANLQFLGQKQKNLCQRAVRDLRSGKITPTVYDAFNSDIVSTHGKDAISKKVFSTLSKQGFHAIEDMNDRKYSGYSAKSATIVFDKSRAMVKSVRNVPASEIYKKAQYEVNVMKGKQWVKSRMIIATAGAGLGVGITANSRRNENLVVANYRKQHPNTDLSYEDILRNYYENKGLKKRRTK